MPSIRLSRDAVNHRWLADARDFKKRRRDVDNVANWLRTPPLSVITLGHEIAMPCRVPPKNDATCLVHLNGVSKAQVHATAMWL